MLFLLVPVLACKDAPPPDPHIHDWEQDSSEFHIACEMALFNAMSAAKDWIPHSRDNDACPPGAAEAGKEGCAFATPPPPTRPTRAEAMFVGNLVDNCRNAAPGKPPPNYLLRKQVGELLRTRGDSMSPAKFYTLAACALVHAPSFHGVGVEEHCDKLRVQLAKQIGHDGWWSGHGERCWSPADCLLFDDPPACCKGYPVTAEALGIGPAGARAPMPAPKPAPKPEAKPTPKPTP